VSPLIVVLLQSIKVFPFCQFCHLFFNNLFNIGLHKIVKRDKIVFVRFNFMEYVEKWAPPTFLHIAEIAKNGATLA